MRRTSCSQRGQCPLAGDQPRDVGPPHRQLLDERLDRRDHGQRPRAVRAARQRHLDRFLDVLRHPPATARMTWLPARPLRLGPALVLVPPQRRTRRTVLLFEFGHPRLEPPDLRPQLPKLLLHDQHQADQRLRRFAQQCFDRGSGKWGAGVQSPVL